MRENPKTIHLVGETIDAKRAHQRAQPGELIQLVRGIYIDHDPVAEARFQGFMVRVRSGSGGCKLVHGAAN